MTSIRNLALYLVIGILIFLALLVLAAQLTTLRLVSTADAPLVIEINEWPTPVPTHTPVPQPTYTPTPHPTPSPSENAFMTAVSTGTDLTTANDQVYSVSNRRWHTNDRRLQLPNCTQDVADVHPREYFWILLEPNTTRLREIILAGIDTKFGTIWDGGNNKTLTLDGRSRDLYAYRTTIAYPCGSSTQVGIGGQPITIVVAGD